MSDQEYGKKLVEGMELEPFLYEYERVSNLTLAVIASGERPDFIVQRSDGLELGLELTKVTRGPQSAFADMVLRGEVLSDPIDSGIALQELVYRKDAKRSSPGWALPDQTILVLQLMDSDIDEVASFLDKEVMEEMSATGFLEIWLVDYSILGSYGTVQLLGIKPTRWRGLHPHWKTGTKPYG